MTFFLRRPVPTDLNQSGALASVELVLIGLKTAHLLAANAHFTGAILSVMSPLSVCVAPIKQDLTCFVVQRVLQFWGGVERDHAKSSSCVSFPGSYQTVDI